MSEFTEVPWIAVKRSDDPEDKIWQVRCEHFELGSGEPHMVHNHCSESRARLIAAAPELLKKLKELVDACDGNYRELTEECNAVITKAEAPPETK